MRVLVIASAWGSHGPNRILEMLPGDFEEAVSPLEEG